MLCCIAIITVIHVHTPCSSSATDLERSTGFQPKSTGTWEELRDIPGRAKLWHLRERWGYPQIVQNLSLGLLQGGHKNILRSFPVTCSQVLTVTVMHDYWFQHYPGYLLSSISVLSCQGNNVSGYKSFMLISNTDFQWPYIRVSGGSVLWNVEFHVYQQAKTLYCKKFSFLEIYSIS